MVVVFVASAICGFPLVQDLHQAAFKWISGMQESPDNGVALMFGSLHRVREVLYDQGLETRHELISREKWKLILLQQGGSRWGDVKLRGERIGEGGVRLRVSRNYVFIVIRVLLDRVVHNAKECDNACGEIDGILRDIKNLWRK